MTRPPTFTLDSARSSGTEPRWLLTSTSMYLGGAYQMYLFNTNYIFFYVSTIPKYAFGFSGWKEAQNTDDVAGQYFYDGDLVFDAPRLMANLAFQRPVRKGD